MKPAIYSLAIGVTLCLSVTGEIDLFSEWKYGPRPQTRSISDVGEDDMPAYRFYKDGYDPDKLPQALREIGNQIHMQKMHRAKAQAQTQSYMRSEFKFPDPAVGFHKKMLENFERLILNRATQQMLDDVRPYPPPEVIPYNYREEMTEREFEPDRPVYANVEEWDPPRGGGRLQDEDRSVEEENTEAFKAPAYKVETLDDPSQFAYPPSDPRYFEETSEIQTARKEFERETEIEIKPDPVTNEFKTIHSSSTEEEKEEDDTTPSIYQENIAKLTAPMMRQEGVDDSVIVRKQLHTEETTGVYIIAMVAGISAAATVGLIAFGIGWYNLQKHVKNASDVEYPAYGVTGPNKEGSPSGDRRLAQSAQMYHYQHQKQQIIAMERAATNERQGSVSEAESDEENEEGDYTVYECPGLAPTGEMEVKNPLFQDDPTPAQTPAVKGAEIKKK